MPDSATVCRPWQPIPDLPPVEEWVDPLLTVAEAGLPVTFHMMDAINFHGLDSIGGVVLGVRLLQRAAAELSPHGLVERRELSLFTSFPGLGARDAFELVARMASEGRFHLDTAFEDVRAPEGVAGRFYFRFMYRGLSVALVPPAGIPDANFVRLGRESKKAGVVAAVMAQWRAAKFSLARLLLVTDAASALRVLEP